MSQDKNIKVSIGSDEGQFARIRAQVQGLIADFTKLAEASGKAANNMGGAMGGATISGKPGVTSAQSANAIARTPAMGKPLVQSVVDHRSLFAGLANGSKDSMRMMTDSLKQAVSMQQRELETLDRRAKQLTETYDHLGRKMAMVKEFPGLARPGENPEVGRTAVLGKHVEVQGRRARLEKELKENQAIGRGLGIREGMGEEEGGGGGMGSWMTKPRQISPRGQMAMRIGGMILAGGAAALNETLAGATGVQALRAGRVASVEPTFQRIMAGDVKSVLAANRARMMGEGGDLIDASMGTASSIKAKAGGVSQMAASALGAVGLGNVAAGFGMKDMGGGMFGGFTAMAQETARAEMAKKHLEIQAAALSPMTKYTMDQFQGQLGARISAGRILGLGLSRDKNGNFRDTYGARESALTAQGYSIGEEQSAYTSMRGSAGARFAGANSGYGMAAAAAGYGGFSELLSAGARAGAGNRLGLSAAWGGIDASAGIQLGQAIIGSGFDPRGTTNGLGLMAAAQGGFAWTRGPEDFNQAQRVGAGAGLLDKVSTGGLDAYQRGRNLVDAINRNPNGSIYSQDYLANGMNMRQMLDMGFGNSALTASADSLLTGTEKEKRAMIRGSATDKVSSIMDRWTDTGGTDTLSTTMKKYRASGQGLDQFLKGATVSEQRALGAFLGQETGEGEEAGLGAVGLISGMGAKLKMGKGLGGGVGEGEKAALEADAKNRAAASKALANIAVELEAAYKKAPEDAVAAEKFASDWNSSSRDLITALGNLTDAIKGREPKPQTAEERAEEGRVTAVRRKQQAKFGER